MERATVRVHRSSAPPGEETTPPEILRLLPVDRGEMSVQHEKVSA